MKILLINRWLGYNQGGNETHMQDLIKWFVKMKHNVTVITAKGTAIEYLSEDIKIYYVKTR